MSTAVAVKSEPTALGRIEQVLIGGDLSKLSEMERLSYYKSVCETVGLNPLTKPFDYITLNGKLVLYAKRDATDQLRKIHNVSIKISARETIEGVYVVTAQARMVSGREDESTGAVHTAGLKGDMLANAYMKAETKAKRRVTLSICGLGMLDETEVADIPDSSKAPTNPGPAQILPQQPESGDGNTEPVDYRIGWGIWKGKSLEQIYRTEGPKAIEKQLTRIQSEEYQKRYGELGAVHYEFIERAEDYLGMMENRDPEDVAVELSTPARIVK